MSIDINGIEYNLTFRWYDIPTIGGWFIDIADASSSPIVCGIALVTATNILGPYMYEEIGGAGTIMFIVSDGEDPYAEPTYTNLGIQSHLYYYVP
jgi:hypothetical protein